MWEKIIPPKGNSYNFDFLQKLCREFSIQLTEEYKQTSKRTIIRGICQGNRYNCNKTFEKGFSYLPQTGPYCMNCSSASKRGFDIEYVKNWLVENKKPFVCISTEYKNKESPMKWKCTVEDCQHIWQTRFGCIKNAGNGCPACNGKIRFTLEYVKNWIVEHDRKLECLSEEYVNITTPLRWRCLMEDCGNVWDSPFKLIKALKHGCMDCRKLSLEYVHEWLKENDKPIVCLSTEYKSSHTSMTWKCTAKHCGYVWNTSFGNISHGTGCSACIREVNYSIEYIHNWLEENKRPIKCLSTEYINTNTKMTWKCTEKYCGYIWETGWLYVKNGTGCKNCLGKVKLTFVQIISELEEQKRDIECLETEYINNRVLMKWKCTKPDYNREFILPVSKLRYKNQGCPFCKNKTEKKILNWLDRLNIKFSFQPKFDWCKNKKCLPFDFFLPEYKLIIELDGSHRWKQRNKFKTPEENCETDIFKQRQAILNGFSVVRIFQEDVWFDSTNWKSDLKNQFYLRETPEIVYIAQDTRYISHTDWSTECDENSVGVFFKATKLNTD